MNGCVRVLTGMWVYVQMCGTVNKYMEVQTGVWEYEQIVGV